MKWLYRKRKSPYATALYIRAGKEGLIKFGRHSPIAQHRFDIILRRYKPETSPFKLFLIDWAIPMAIGWVMGDKLVDWVGNGYAILLILPTGLFIGSLYGMTLGPWLKGQR